MSMTSSERAVAVDLHDQPLGGQSLDVATHRHVGDVKEVDHLGDARAAGAVDLAQDGLLSLSRQAT
jgi:hypothetical protein